MRNKLRDSEIRGIRTPALLSDGDGLYLRVQSATRRSWVFIWTRYGRRREIGLGPYGQGTREVSLAGARRKADEAREIVGRGGDPKLEMAERKAAAEIHSFGKVADEYVAAMAEKWSEKTLAAWKRFAETYAKPIRRIPVDAIVTDDVVRLLRPMWTAKPETATKVRERVKIVLDNAKARGFRHGDNPALWVGHLDQILPPVKKLTRGHHAAMPYPDVPAFIAKLRQTVTVGARALEFTIVTAVRSGETRGAVWSEFDLDAKVWTVPPERMKARTAHRVPLTDRAVEIVRAMKEVSINEYVFAGANTRRPLSDMTLLKVLETHGGGDFTVHGFRSCFSTWCAEETLHQREVAEAALAHAVGDSVERAYRRGDVLAKRRALMEDWAAFIGGHDGAAT